MVNRLAAVILSGVVTGGFATTPDQALARIAPLVYESVTGPKLKPGMAISHPKGPVVLTVNGRIGADQPIRFDPPILESLGLVRFTTITNWTADPSVFEGVLLSILLYVVGTGSATTALKLIALNDYESPIPAADARTWLVMLALKRDNEYMSRRDRSPIWMVHSQHAYPEAGHRDFLSCLVWQLKATTVE